jgi:dipeptidyl aminopeptidase/acylaminoacyl peptidase
MSVDGKPAYEVLSPLHAARCANDNLHRYMPSCLLMHGTVDNSVPFASTLLMNDALQEAGVSATHRPS